MSRGRLYRMLGGPKDGAILRFHEGSGAIFMVNLQTVPGARPIPGRARYQFDTEPDADGFYAARYVETVADEPPPLVW